MNSRGKILSAVSKNKPAMEAMPDLQLIDAIRFDETKEKFKTVLEGIGGKLELADNINDVTGYVRNHFKDSNKYVTTINGLEGIEKINDVGDAHKLEDVEVAIIRGEFGVAENGSVWVTGMSVKIRVLPFICQHLVVLLDPHTILHNMHEAYLKIDNSLYDFAVFIAGPSKTADIEQSLVLGAHGPRTMTVFFIDSKNIPG